MVEFKPFAPFQGIQKNFIYKMILQQDGKH